MITCPVLLIYASHLIYAKADFMLATIISLIVTSVLMVCGKWYHLDRYNRSNTYKNKESPVSTNVDSGDSQLWSAMLLPGTTAVAESNSTYANVENARDVAGNVIITNGGVTINGIYYTKAEFEELLNKVIKIKTPETRAAIAAGIYFILQV